MFGRRRRPILGAAVVVGASRAAAKREVRKQGILATERDQEIEREVELRKYQDEQQEIRAQRAVDEAIKKSGLQEQAALQNTAPLPIPPQQQYNAAFPVIQSQPREMGFYESTAQSAQDYRPVPEYQLAPQFAEERPRKSPIPRQNPDSRIRYCTQCGQTCQYTDRFCRQCGIKQPCQEDVVG
ncbi:hypothetical protein EDB82DRAFT_510374 [Fusarium venenatum]|uniref:uncharacterized protein n=1 Tax=Fusarium venenatum TaxID=56646 RepID=UPI001D672A8D|nr:hypothetical protein EDB82DRAFT_510374 [Fusarium venenatum]